MNIKKIWVVLIVFFMLPLGLAVNIELSDQGTGAKQAGSLVDNGNLTVEIWNAATAGTLIWSETYVDAIQDGSWNIMLGQNASNPLSLEYGQKYWKDYKINSLDIDFHNNLGSTTERLEFYSPLGYINSKTLFNFSMINPCAEGYAIRSVNTDGTVVCENIGLRGSIASGWNDTGTVIELINSMDNVKANTLYVDNTNARVGIGTTLPAQAMHVVGNAYLENGFFGIGSSNPVKALDVRGDTYISGKLGLGAISSLYRLYVNGTLYADTIDTGSGNMTLGDANVTDGDVDSIPTNDQVYDFVAEYIGAGGTGDIYVDEAGDNMTGNLDMNGNKIINVSKLHATSIGIANTSENAEANLPANYSMYIQDDLKVDGTIYGTLGDIAEIVYTSGELEPGDVVVIKGALTVEKSTKPYDTGVAGIISTDPSYILSVERDGLPLALSGIVPVKVTNESGYIKPKDLLTTSSKAGYAMKCSNPDMCKGAILGKAMDYLNESEGMIDVLVMLG